MPLAAQTHLAVEGEESSNQERRRGLRIRQARPIKIFEPVLSRYFGGQTEDISSAGLRIELPLAVPVRPGTLVNVHVGLNDAGQPLVNQRHMVPARIIWVDRSTQCQRGRLVAGLEFAASIAAQMDAA